MSIELLNVHKNGDGKMTQVTPVLPETVVIDDPNAFKSDQIDQHISLHQAARDGRIDVINYRMFKLGRSGSNRRFKALNKLDEDGVSPIHYAVRYGHHNIVKLLVENGAEVDIIGPDGATPLHFAARFFATSLKVRQQSTADETETFKLSLEDVLRVYTSDVDNISIAGDEDSIIDYLIEVKARINAQDNYGMTPLHYAAMKTNIAAVKELLQCDEIKVDETDSSGGTPLHVACNEGALLIAQALVKRGADIRAKDHEGMTPLHFACSEGHLDVVKFLIKRAEETGGTNMVESMLTDKNYEKESVLHSATDGGHLGVVQFCIEKGANVRDVRTNNTQPLHLAAISGNIHIAKLLIDHGANIEARNINYETPLHRAASFNRVEFVTYLLDQGANIESRDKDNFTPLLSAASEGHTEVVSTLLNRGANLSCEDRHNKTAFFMAAEQNCVDTLKELLDNPLTSNKLINKSNLYEDTPLHVAAMKGFVVVAELLLSKGAKIDSRNDEEYTPLHLAAKYGRTRTVQALLKRDSSIINDEDEASNIPLHLASIEGHWKCVRELLESGSPVDARNVNLWTPLDCAAASGHVKTAAILLDYDSPVDPTDKARTTPLHLASREGHVDMVQLLLSRNADIAMTDHTGRNCLDMAIDKGQKEVATAIVKDKRWMEAMKNKSLEHGKATTPMRKLIFKLPDVAEIVLNQCVTDNGLPTYHHDYEITMNYEFLEDVYADWFTEISFGGSSTGSETGSVHSVQLEKSEYGYAMIEDEKMKQAATAQLERKSNHPLMIMVKKSRETLVSHPLVSFLLAKKWSKYGRAVYYLKLFVFVVFLFFLTGYSLVTTSHRSSIIGSRNKSQECSLASSINKAEQRFFIDAGSIIVLVLACWHILMELFQMVYQFFDYINWENLLEWVTFVTSIVYVIPEFQDSVSIGLEKCSDWHPSVGAVSIFCAWMCLLMFIRKFPKLGIYVVMFTDILYTFVKFSIIFVLFIVAFALAFYTLLADLESFNSAGRSLVKTGVMMIGEFEFDDLFKNQVPGLTWFLFVIFLIVMTLILMNLLIGLAVDDIKGVQDQALLKRQAMLVDLALNVEKAMPRKLRKRLIVLKESYFPNHHRGIWRLISQPTVSPQEMKEALELEKPLIQKMEEHNDSLSKGVKALKNRMKELQEQQETLQSMLKAVVKKLEITLEDDAGDEDEHI